MIIDKKSLEITRLFSVWIPVWDAVLIVTYGNDLEFLKKAFNDQPDWKKEKRKLFEKQLELIFQEKGSTGGCYMYHEESSYHYIHVFRKKTPGVFLNHLSHEILHMVSGLLRDRGMEHSRKSEEAYTYLQGFLTQKIMEQMFPIENKNKKKKNKRI